MSSDIVERQCLLHFTYRLLKALSEDEFWRLVSVVGNEDVKNYLRQGVHPFITSLEFVKERMGYRGLYDAVNQYMCGYIVAPQYWEETVGIVPCMRKKLANVPPVTKAYGSVYVPALHTQVHLSAHAWGRWEERCRIVYGRGVHQTRWARLRTLVEALKRARVEELTPAGKVTRLLQHEEHATYWRDPETGVRFVISPEHTVVTVEIPSVPGRLVHT